MEVGFQSEYENGGNSWLNGCVTVLWLCMTAGMSTVANMNNICSSVKKILWNETII